MARPSSPIQKEKLTISLPLDIYTRMNIEHFSETEGRVPYGAHSDLIESLLRRHFAAVDGRAAIAHASSHIPKALT